MEKITNQPPQGKIDEAWRRISRFVSFDEGEALHPNMITIGPLYDIGQFELAKRISYAFFKFYLDMLLKEDNPTELGSQISHTISKGYWDLLAAGVDNEFRRKLGELLGLVYEAGGSKFDVAYEYYRENYPEKYADKLKSVRLEGDEDEDWRVRIPSRNRKEAFPDFHGSATKEEHDKLVKKELEDFMKYIPEEIMNINTEIELKTLLGEIKKLQRE